MRYKSLKVVPDTNLGIKTMKTKILTFLVCIFSLVVSANEEQTMLHSEIGTLKSASEKPMKVRQPSKIKKETIASSLCGDNLTWSLESETGVLTISGSGDMYDFYDIYDEEGQWISCATPWYEYASSIVAVNLPNGLTSIGINAFSDCVNLSTIDIPNTVISIGDYAFYSCYGLETVTVPNNLVNIGSSAFYSCTSLTSFALPNSVTDIGDYAFSGCTSLASPIFNANIFAQLPRSYAGAYAIPDGIKTVSNSACRECSGLTSIIIPNSVTAVGSDAFENCTGLTSATLSNSLTRIEEYLFYGCTNLASVNIPQNVKSIGTGAFYQCSGLNAITLPDSVTTIEAYAFNRCTGLTSFVLPDSVTSVGNFAFYGCIGITNPIYNTHLFAYMPATYTGEYTIPDNIESIAGTAFFDCTHITALTCNAVTPPALGAYVFRGMNMLIPIYVPEGSVSIYKTTDQWADFANIYAIQGTKIISIDGDFSDWENVPAERLAEASANDSALLKNLYDIKFCTDENAIYFYLEYNASTNAVQYISILMDTDDDSYTGYNMDTRWDNSAADYLIQANAEMSSSVLHSFDGANQRTWSWEFIERDIVIASNSLILSNGNKAIEGCIQKSSIPSQVIALKVGVYTSNGDWAETGNLPQITYNSETEISTLRSLLEVPVVGVDESTPVSGRHYINGLYYNLKGFNQTAEVDKKQDISSMTVIEIPASVEYRGHTYAVTSIRNEAFFNCSSLTQVTVPSSVTYIGNLAFGRCKNLLSVHVAADNPNYCDVNGVLFNKAQTILMQYPIAVTATEYSIPEGVVTIAAQAFIDCKNLTSVSFPNSLKNIETQAFGYCDGLTSVNIGNNVEQIYPTAFGGCKGLLAFNVADDNPHYRSVDSVLFNNDTTILLQFPCGKKWEYIIPSSVTDINSDAFEFCSGLTHVVISANVTTIGRAAFYECTGLRAITCLAVAPPTAEDYAFYSVDKSIPLYVPEQSIAAYQSANQWSEFTNIQSASDEPVVNPGGTCGDNLKWEYANHVLTISGTGAMTNYAAYNDVPWKDFDLLIQRVVVSEGVTNIRCNVFLYCDSLTAFDVAKNNSKYCSEDGVLFNKAKTKLIQYPRGKANKAYVIPGGVTDIADEAFVVCYNLDSIVISQKVSFIGEESFRGCPNLKAITCFALDPPILRATSFLDVNKSIPLYVPAGSINAYQAAYYWSEFSNILADASIPTSGSCGANLTWEIINEELVINGAGEMYDYNIAPWSGYAASIFRITLPEGLTKIGKDAFAGCVIVPLIYLPKSLANIGTRAFADCVGLTEITSNASVPPTLGDSVFYGVDKSIPLHVLYGCSNAYRSAGQWSEFTNIQENPAPVISNVKIGDLYYNLRPLGKTAEVVRGDYAALSEVNIPASVIYEDEQYSVGAIGDSAFYNCTNLTQIGIANSIKWIGGRAFCNCTGLTSAEIPDSVSIIRESLFDNCQNLQSVKLSSNATEISSHVFNNCYRLKSIVIPSGVTSIGYDAFASCNSLTRVFIADIPTWLGISFTNRSSNPLYYAGTLYLGDGEDEYPDADDIVTSLVIPDGIQTINNYAFVRCTSLTSVTIPSSVLTIGDEAFYNANKITSVSIGDGVTAIGDGAFRNCTKLTSLTIGQNVKSIGYEAFGYCYGLTTVSLPNGVTSIGANAFTYCDKMATIAIPSTVVSIGAGAFSYCGDLTSFEIPAGVTKIERSTFYSCFDLTTVTIPTSVTSIGDLAFNSCRKLNSPVIPDSVTSIGDYAFTGVLNIIYHGSATGSPWGAQYVNGYVDGYLVYNDESKTEVVSCSRNATGTITIPESVTAIGDKAFYDCYQISSFNIPNTVTTIGNSAFSGCRGITSITIPNSVISIGDYAFAGCSQLTSPVMNNRIFAYLPSSYSSSSYTVPDGIEVIAGAAFYDNSKLTSVTIPNSVTSIGNYAFAYRTKLTSVQIGSNVTTIGREAFSNCDGLTSIALPNSLVSIGDYAFSSCDSVTAFVIPDNVVTIGEGAFTWCNGLTSVTIGESVAIIGNKAFSYCTQLPSITMPNSVKTIGDEAFVECLELTSVSFGDSVMSIGEKAFYYCGKLTSIDIPNSVATIGQEAFEYCGLTSVFIPNGITNLETKAFAECKNLATVIVGDSVTSLTDYLFDGCTGLTSVTIGKNMVNIGYPFTKCNNITSVVWNAKNSKAYKFGAQVESFVFGDAVEVIPNSICSGMTLLTSVIIPENVQTISELAFRGCTGLALMIIPNSVTSIESLAFSGCTGLTSISIPENVTNLDQDAFYGCNNLLSVTLKSNAIVSRNYDWYTSMIDFFGTQVIEYIIGDKVTGIGQNAFKNASNVTSITIPASVTSIGENAFLASNNINKICFTGDVQKWCEKTWRPIQISSNYALYIGEEKISNVVIPNSTDSVCVGAFEGCKSLSSVQISDGITSIGDSAFFRCENLEAIQIPNSVTTIGKGAFSDCSKLASITLPENLTVIEDNVFYGCRFGSITLPDGITSIGKGAFSWNYLTSIVIPNRVKTIGEDAFKYCSRITSVILGDSVTTIGEDAFYGCNNLTAIEIPNSVINIGYEAFDNCSRLLSVTLNSDSIVSRKYTTDYNMCSLFGKQVTGYIIGDSVKSIGERAFHNCYKLASLTIGSNVEYIGDYAFFADTCLTVVTLPNSVNTVGEAPFFRCNNLTQPIYNDHLFVCLPITHVGDYAVPEGIESIAMGAFAYCDGLTAVQIPSGVTNIDDFTFEGCVALTAASLPQSVTRIGENAFAYCVNLPAINIPEDVTEIGPQAFRECSSLTSVTVPDEVTRIGEYAFFACQLQSVVLGSDVEMIAYRAFDGNLEIEGIDQNNQFIYSTDGSGNYITTIDTVISYNMIPPTVEDVSTYMSNVEIGGGIANFLMIMSNALVFVPADAYSTYKADAVWGQLHLYAIGDDPMSIFNPSDSSDDSNSSYGKRLINGQIYILRGDKIYTIQGQEVK